jgi:predicted DsbA family dithiol-disulfide isomerase
MIRMDVFHDTACPWCRIGKRHLKMALANWQGEPVEVVYHAFFLNPDIPPEGYDFRPYMHAKGGGRVALEDWFAAPRQMGASVGVTFNFEAMTRAPNTLLSHRLIALTLEEKREAVIDAVYAAYFEHGRDIGDLDTLVAIAGEQGMDGNTIRQRLLTDEAAATVLSDVRQARELGITGVPFFVVNNRYALSGAQPPSLFTRALQQVQSDKAASEPSQMHDEPYEQR